MLYITPVSSGLAHGCQAWQGPVSWLYPLSEVSSGGETWHFSPSSLMSVAQ